MLASASSFFSNSLMDILNIINKLSCSTLRGLNEHCFCLFGIFYCFFFLSLSYIVMVAVVCAYSPESELFIQWINGHHWVPCERWQSDEWLWCLWDKVQELLSVTIGRGINNHNLVAKGNHRRLRKRNLQAWKVQRLTHNTWNCACGVS